MKQNFVHFFSPGTFVAEESRRLVDSWDVDKAIELSKTIKERHGAVPYGFCFTVRERKSDDLDSHEIARSGMFFLGGSILTLQYLKIQNDSKDKILISNMEANNWDRIVINDNSWRSSQPLKDGDVVLPI